MFHLPSDDSDDSTKRTKKVIKKVKKAVMEISHGVRCWQVYSRKTGIVKPKHGHDKACQFLSANVRFVIWRLSLGPISCGFY
jgi:hypothetical protein